MQNTIIFAISFFAGLLWFRLIFLLLPKYFSKPFTRTKTKLTVHHLHFGIVFVLLGTFVLLADSANFFVYAFLGFGLGQIFDLFIPSLLMKGDRKAELKLYKDSFLHTLILALFIVGTAFLIISLI